MSELTNEEYLALCQKLLDQQYDDSVDDYDISKMEWIPSDSEIKEKMIKVNHNGMIDLTNVKSGKIKEEIFKCGNLKVGDFKIIINSFSGTAQEKDKLCCSLRIMGHQSKTMNGMPCNMDIDVNLKKDTRFNGRPWLKHFGSNYGSDIPVDTVVEIVRWLQAIKKMTAFL